MPKASTRFRNRKINFKTRIAIRTGCLDVPSDHEDEEFGFEEDRQPSAAGTAGERIGQLETGVDKEEESEHHLQKVISASTAALLRSTVNENLPASPASLAEAAQLATESAHATSLQHVTPHIPIPDATGLVDPAAYEALYAHSKIFLPSSYIRFSDTVEDILDGVIYTMDEEDQIWLDDFNSDVAVRARAHEALKSSSTSNGEDVKGKRSTGRKGKEKERTEPEPEVPGVLSADDFETIMDHFEKTTEDTVPGLHLDTNRCPSLADFEHSFEGTLSNPRLLSIKIFAKFVYCHWKERRLKRGGKPIMPAIDFDESNENNPYVCFRRREIKTVRKTRRTDAQNMDRLIRLRDDLHKAQELLNTVLSRERVKREVVELEKAIFEGRCMVREMKRTLKEPDGDENLLVDKKEKKRKREGSGFGIVKSPVRKAGGLPANGYTTTALTCPQDILLLREKIKAANRSMDREFARRREEQNGWEDLTDSAYQPMALPTAAMRWRGPLVSDAASVSKSGRELASGPEQGITFATPVVDSNQYRKRVGRGGRFMLDRVNPPHQRSWRPPAEPFASTSTSHLFAQDEESARDRRLTERWRFDDDLRNEFPSLEDPPLIDDYSLPYVSKRRNLLDVTDLECLQSHSDTHLSRVSEYLNREPDPGPPIVKIGKMPVKTLNVNNLFNMGYSRPQFQPASVAQAEQLLAARAAAQMQHASGIALNKRTPSASHAMNGNGSAQLTPRVRRNPSNSAGLSSSPIPGNNPSNPSQQQLHDPGSGGWPNGSMPSVIASGGHNGSAGPTSNGAPGIHIPVPFSGVPGSPRGLSRSIPIPANNSPGVRMMNGTNIPINLSNGSLPISHSTNTRSSSSNSSVHRQLSGSPRPCSAASPPPMSTSNGLSLKSPGIRQTTAKRPVHQLSPPPSSPTTPRPNHQRMFASSPPVINNSPSPGKQVLVSGGGALPHHLLGGPGSQSAGNVYGGPVFN